MRSALFPNFLPQRPHSFWLFLSVTVSVFLASLALKAPDLAQNITAYWHQENPIALADFSACPERNLKNLQRDFSKNFSSWHLTPLKESAFKTPLPLNGKIEFIFSLSPKTERHHNLSLRPAIEKFLSQSCPQSSFATLPEIEQQEVDSKSLSLEENAAKLSHFLEFLTATFFCASLFFFGKERFALSLPLLKFLSESSLSAFKISLQTLKSLNFSLCFGLFSGLFGAHLCYAAFSAYFFQKSCFKLFFHALREQLVAIAHLSATPDLLLILTILSLYGVMLFFFIHALSKKLQKRRQTRIFLSDNNPFG